MHPGLKKLLDEDPKAGPRPVNIRDIRKMFGPTKTELSPIRKKKHRAGKQKKETRQDETT